jgi:nucleoside-diphosphate-sugar epimerase
MPLKNKMIFLAGATGLAGSSIIKHILENDPSTHIKGVYYKTPPFLHHQNLSYVKADLTKKVECRNAVRGCDVAIMAAASTGGAGAAVTDPHRQVTDNLVMDALMLEAMHYEGVKRAVYLSSATVYQVFDGYIKEDGLDWNQNPHPSYLGIGWAKRSAEKLCQFWHDQYGMEIIIVRCSNIYGPYAQFDPDTSNFIPALIRKAVAKMEPFEVWGSPNISRDVIYAKDLAAAILQLLKHDEIKFDIFNLGFGKPTTVGEVVDLVLCHAGHKDAKIIYSKDKPTTIPLRALDCTKIKKCLNWKPIHSITEGINKTTQWWIENKDRWTK